MNWRILSFISILALCIAIYSCAREKVCAEQNFNDFVSACKSRDEWARAWRAEKVKNSGEAETDRIINALRNDEAADASRDRRGEGGG